ncbi:hypothetical protein DEA8626_04021 [Defluviimonas aquaemixtae]|uniref:DUF2948 domain-containing protein n=1 Tax=Albidovulum aquaemixtae TaxID=1542388 RepID=A0A2R8BNG1_9RHOB|nr:DUF2948 family protein [Defluviimonas aquaemixtae]SPH24988.1 hypothetical protein DEA8626_04021 [Defluviimonas aquaemixtae]
MVEDARFEDAGGRAVYLKAEAAEDLPVISALVQDAVLSAVDMTWQPQARRLAFLVNRFRWEDVEAAEARGRPYERVRSLLVLDGVMKVASQGIDRRDADAILSILSITWKPGEAPAGRVEIVLAGDGAIAAEVECLDVTLKDVTRPYVAPSHKAPVHPE